MKKSNQAGFTLIELIIVIVILGILAVTASPKFLDIQSDAKESTLQGVAASLKGAANIVYSKSLIEGVAGAANQTLQLDANTSVRVDFGYPEAQEAALREVVGLETTEWEVGVNTVNNVRTARIYPIGNYDGNANGQNNNLGNDLDCYVEYALDDSSANEPVITVTTGGC